MDLRISQQMENHIYIPFTRKSIIFYRRGNGFKAWQLFTQIFSIGAGKLQLEFALRQLQLDFSSQISLSIKIL